jgi:hypothetical protein
MAQAPDPERGGRAEARVAASVPAKDQTDFYGLIQHSFALRIPSELHPQYTRSDISEPCVLLRALLDVPACDRGPGFSLMPVDRMAGEGKRGGYYGPTPDHSLLVENETATVALQGLPFLGRDPSGREYPLPKPFSWAGRSVPTVRSSKSDPAKTQEAEPWEGFITAAKDRCDRAQAKDFLIVEEASSPGRQPGSADPEAVSWLLCQLLAHRRSRLFGLSLAQRIFNVLLPHALLRPTQANGVHGEWLVQPVLALFRANENHEFRRIFSLTLFLVPVAIEDSGKITVGERKMSHKEIRQTVQAGWSLATAPPRIGALFTLSGPLCGYLTKLDPSIADWKGLGEANTRSGLEGSSLTVRQATEAIFFATAQRMVEGPEYRADDETRKEVGGQVLSSLSASRVSSVTVVDRHFEHPQSEGSEEFAPQGEDWFPGSLGPLMETIAGLIRVSARRKYRLDRPFFDEPTHAIGVLPANSCVVVTADVAAQQGHQESALLQAGWIAYMAIGASMATGMVRSIYDDIETVDRSKPRAIAEIEHEVVVDLHEIYDLDITWEQYRDRYYRLRNSLGITRDYQSLQNKLQGLSREASTRFEGASQRRLIWLTAAIVLLTFVVAILTVLPK